MNFSKRIFSLVLSVLMVIASMPTFAITTMAVEENNVVAALLTDNNHEGANWTEEAGGSAYIDNNNTITFNSVDLSSINYSSGFTVRYKAKVNTGSSVTGKIASFTGNGGEMYFYCGSTGGDVWRTFQSGITKDGAVCNYYTADLLNGNYCDTSGVDNSNFAWNEFENDEWYTVQITMNTNGMLYYYIDNVLRGKFKYDYWNQNGNNLTPENQVSAVAGFNECTFGGDNFQGYVKDVYVFNVALDAEETRNQIAKYNSDSNPVIEMYSSDGYDNVIYTHGTNLLSVDGINLASDYMFYGNQIADGSVNTKYQVQSGTKVYKNIGYEQGERATYIGVPAGYTINSAVCGSDTLTLTKDSGHIPSATSSRNYFDTYYLISGNLSDCTFSDTDKAPREKVITCNITSPNGETFDKNFYVTVMPNPVSANSISSFYTQWGSGSSTKKREANTLMIAQGSTGSITSTTNDQYVGNYTYLDNPIYIGGLNGWSCYDNSNNNIKNYSTLGGSVNGTKGLVNAAGGFDSWVTTGDINISNNSNLYSTVVANYYVDKSKLSNANQELSGVRFDSSGNYSINVLLGEVSGYATETSNRISSVSSENVSNLTWNADVSGFEASGSLNGDTHNTITNVGTIPNGTVMKNANTTLNGNVNNGNASITPKFTRAHDSNRTSNALLNVKVNVFDKSAVYDLVKQYSNLNSNDYNNLTWSNFENALKEATYYCNDYTNTDVSRVNELKSSLENAYNNLLSFSDFNNFKETFELGQINDLSGYTVTTSEKYLENINKVETEYFSDDWKNITKTKTDYTNADFAGVIDFLNATLNPLAVKTDYIEYNDAVEKIENGIFSGNMQVYTLDSWNNLKNVVDAVNLDGVGKYDEILMPTSTWNNIAFDYYLVDTSVDSKGVADMKTVISEAQLIEVDKDRLEVFDSACEVARTIPVSSYDPEYREDTVNTVEKLHDDVYVSVASAEVDYGLTIPDNFDSEIVKNSSNIDNKTAEILVQLSGLEDNYGKFNITIEDIVYSDVQYGTKQELPIKYVPGEWKITDTNGQIITIFASAGKQIYVTVESEFTAVFNESVEGDSSNTYRVDVYDGYGRISKIIYTNSEVTKDNLEMLGIEPKVIPFYEFKEWKIELNDSDSSYKVTPVYVYNAVVMYTVKSLGNDFGSYKFDTRVKLEVSDSSTPYGWVNKTIDGKYQIVSYKPVFEFYVCSDGDYYPFYKYEDATGYYVLEQNNQIKLTSDNVYDNIMPIGYTNQTKDEHLNFKLDNQYPFIYVESTGVASADENKYRVNARFTQQNENKYMAFGVNIKYNGNYYKFNCSSKTDTDQFMFTVKIGSAKEGDTINFMPYINHWFMYGEGEGAEKIDAFYYDEQLLTV